MQRCWGSDKVGVAGAGEPEPVGEKESETREGGIENEREIQRNKR